MKLKRLNEFTFGDGLWAGFMLGMFVGFGISLL